MKIQRQFMTRSLKKVLFPWLALAVLAPALPALLISCSNMMTNNPNRAPVTSISPAAFSAIYPGNPVTFDATGTFDPDDQDLEVRWEVIDSPPGSTYFLYNARSFRPTFVTYFRNAPGSAASDRWIAGPEDYSVPPYLGNYTLRMTVTDKYGVQRSSNVTVNVANSAPGADAGNNVTGIVPAANDTVPALELSGTGGGNEESSRRNTWQYRWSVTDKPRDSDFSLTNTDWTDPSDADIANTAVADFTPLTTGSDLKPGQGVYTLRLEVRDEYGATSTNSLLVVTDDNTRPGLTMPNPTNVTVSSTAAAADGDGSTTEPYRYNAATDPDYAININYTTDEVTNEEDDTMTVTWRVHSLRAGVEQLRFRVDGGADQLFSAGNTIKTQGIVRGDEADFELDIAPAADLTDVFRYTAAGPNPGATANSDTDWDVAIQVVANDGAVADETPPIIYISLYTPTP